MKGGSKMAASTSSKDSNSMAAVAYVLTILTGVLMFVMKPEDKFVKFHAVQSILLFISFFVIGAVINILSIIFMVVGGTALLGLWLSGIILLEIILVLVSLYCIFKAYSGERFKLPIIGNMAENFAK